MLNPEFTIKTIIQAINNSAQLENILWQKLLESETLQICDGPRLFPTLKKDISVPKLLIGLCPFTISKVTAKSQWAQNLTVQNLEQAFLACNTNTSRCATFSCSYDPISEFSREYLQAVLLLSRKSPALASVCCGLDIAATKILASSDFDRLSVEMFLQHFSVQFRFRGLNQQEMSSTIQSLYVELPSASKRLYKQKRMLLLSQLCSLSLIPSQKIVCSQTNKNFQYFWDFCQEAGLSQPTIERFLNLAGHDERTAYNRSRVLVKKNKKALFPTHPPEKEKMHQIKQLTMGLTLQALGSKYDIEDLLTVFCVASLTALKMANCPHLNHCEGFWISWLEKKLKNDLNALAATDSPLCGGILPLSAKNNLLGKYHDTF